MKIKLFLLIMSLTLTLFISPSFAAKDGTITELTAVGSPYSTAGAIQFRCVTTNTGSNPIPSSYCNLTVRYGPTNEYVKSVVYLVPRLARGESYTYLWNTTNVDFPYSSFQTGGSYITTATWDYPSGPDIQSTSFNSVPSGWLWEGIVVILGVIMASFLKKRPSF